MYRKRLIEKKYFYALFPFTFNNADIATDSKTEQTKTLSVFENETGKDRLVRMFKIDEFDNISPELSAVIQVGCMSMFVGAIYGGVLYSRVAYMDFIRNNQATAFKDHLEAKKRLQDKVTLGFAKGAFRWAWRLSLFSTTYVGISTTISTYRGKSGIIEHLIAGTVSGFSYNFINGPRAWIVGAGLGCVLGSLAGVITYGLTSLTGVTMEDVRYWQYKWKENRTSPYKSAIKEQMYQDELLILHKHKFEEEKKHVSDKNVINIPT